MDASKPQSDGLSIGSNILGLFIPVVCVGKVHDVHIIEYHPVQLEHQLDPALPGDALSIVLDLVQALRYTFFLPVRSLIWRMLSSTRTSIPSPSLSKIRRNSAPSLLSITTVSSVTSRTYPETDIMLKL